MNDYGLAALLARKYVVNGICSRPDDGWIRAVGEIFPSSESMREKGCPKGAFLGLCAADKVFGIEPSEDYTKSRLNREYALKAIALLHQDPTFENRPDELWAAVNSGVRHNHQIDVVLALWSAGWIKNDSLSRSTGSNSNLPIWWGFGYSAGCPD